MDKVTFSVNGKGYSVGSEISSTTTLLDYIRNKIGLRGTKYMCREGGCGACIVNVDKGAGSQGINSCMVQLTSCQGWSITTIEKIGNRKDGYHPIQTTLAENHGTQCGYCSPGFVMAMYSLLKKKPLTQLEIENSFASNVCRCTGYRPILKAFKKFGSDAPPSDIMDIEDLKICEKSGKVCSEESCDEEDWCIVPQSEVASNDIFIKLRDGREFYKVGTLKSVLDILHCKGFQSYMLVAGNTAKGAVPIFEYPQTLIDISGVSELRGYYFDQNLVIGANTTLTEVSEILTAVSEVDFFNYLKVLNDHLQLVAHIPVKNLATIAGNLMLKNQNPAFQSDIYLLLETVGAQITILYRQGFKKILPMVDFLKEDMRGKIIVDILLPPLSNSHKIWTNKIMPRSQSAHAIVNCGFLYQLHDNHVVLSCRIVYGGLSSVFNRAFQTENSLVGRPLFTNETLQAALKVLDRELVVTPIPPNPSVEYRKQLALALFYKGLLSLCPANILHKRYASGATKLHPTRPLSSGRQTFDTDPSIYPLNQPIPKIDGLIQCAGEAQYTEDLPTLPDEVFATFVLSTVPLGKIVSIDPNEALRQPGVIAFYSANDIPGINTFTPLEAKYMFKAEEVLCDGEVKYFNQPLGIIVAESLEISERASKLVRVKYENIKKPVIDIKVAKHDPKKVTVFLNIPATKVGTDLKKVLKSDKTIYGQYHFCLETLVCVTQPTEEGLKVNAATQWIDTVQQALSQLLKMDASKIDVAVRRVGGGYGYKLTRESLVAAACSLVVSKLNQPCRFIQSLTHNFRAVGKRFATSTTSEFGVNEKGVIQYINHELFSDNGYIVNELLIVYGLDAYSNCYDKAPWNFTVNNAITDTASNTWCRSPITMESIAMTEWILEQISYELGLDQLEVRLANIDRVTHSDIIEMIQNLKKDSEFDKRREYVDKYNSENRWKKRGLRFSLLRWTPLGPLYSDVNLAVFHKDGTVVITHGGVEIGQGINTRATQICAYLLKIPVEKIQIKPKDTVTCPNTLGTGASITSQNIGIGIKRCCEELLKRLEPVKATMVGATWEQVIQAAFLLDIDLQTHGFVNASDSQMYHIYGVVLCEVEVDVLTGESEILRVDLVEDAGRSVNPQVDIGQVEGAFIMGVGYWTSEQLVYDLDTGEVLSDRTWHYWVPLARDIPQDFRISLKKKSFSTETIFGAKATGEPATCMSVGVAIALREAIVAARSESGIPSTKWFELDGPYTIEKICLFSKTNTKDFKLY